MISFERENKLRKSIEFSILDSSKKEEYISQISEIMTLCDSEFVPPLSQRSSTTQNDLSVKPGRESKNGIDSYLGEMMSQEVLCAICEGRLLGFVSYKEDMAWGNFSEADLPNIYLSTLVLHPDSRGMGLTVKMYDYLFNACYPEKNVFTRTWSTNAAHIKILGKFGFCEAQRIKDDRGVGIDTVYFELRR